MSNSVSVAGFGSLVNAISAGYKNPEPVVGMGATLLMWTDRVAYTVVEVVNSRRIVVQRDKVTRNDTNGMSESQSYTYTPDPDATREVLTLRKNGKWHKQGESVKSSPFALGYRDSYHDYGF